MNTDIITLKEILGTDSVSSSRITINDNFSKLVRAVGDLQTRIDTSKNTIYINVIETESGEFVVKTTPNHTTRFKIDNYGQIYIGAVTLDEYIRRIVNNTKLINLEIFDNAENKMDYQMYSGTGEGNDKANYVNVYYRDSDDLFKVKISVSDTILNLYPNATVIIYDGDYVPEETELGSGSGSGSGQVKPYQTMPLVNFVYRFKFNPGNINTQRTIAINWIPDTAINEIYSFTLQKIEN